MMSTSTLISSLLSAFAAIAFAAPPQPFTPSGGLNNNGTPPVYQPLSDFDFQSLTLALTQEYLELDLFHHGLAQFSVQDFEAVNLTAQDRFLIEYMADQEVGHAQVLTNILGANATKSCTYQYSFTTVREFIDTAQKVTRAGESGALGFMQHLNSRDAAQLVSQAVAVESRQQMVMRQFEGLFPMPVWFEPGITQSMAWTLLAPFLVTCPVENPRLVWQNFPALNVTNNPNATTFINGGINDSTPAITHNQSEPLSNPGRQVLFSWELPGKNVSYNNSYVTNTTAGEPKFVAWISQLNTTFTELTNISGQTGQSIQPSENIFESNNTAPIANGTMFVAITDVNVTVSPANISALNEHIVAGPTFTRPAELLIGTIDQSNSEFSFLRSSPG